MDAEEFRKHGHALVDWIADYRAALARGEPPVQATVRPGEIAAQLPRHAPESPETFEAMLAERVGARHVVAFNSGTAALHAACAAAGVSAGDEVLTTPLSFAASANCARYVGAMPRFVDIDPVTLVTTAEAFAAAAGPTGCGLSGTAHTSAVPSFAAVTRRSHSPAGRVAAASCTDCSAAPIRSSATVSNKPALKASRMAICPGSDTGADSGCFRQARMRCP